MQFGLHEGGSRPNRFGPLSGPRGNVQGRSPMRITEIGSRIGRMPLAVILNLTSFGLATLSLVGLLIAATLLYRAPTRPCHRCGARVPLGLRVCRDCGYDFEPVRFTR
jgi:hypothetical protein